MDIVISGASGEPIYQQIYDRISSQIIKGDIKSETCLPPIRTVAKELGISVITIKRAWEELERDGFIYTIAGKGCFVAPLKEKELEKKRSDMVSEKLKSDMEYYKKLGITKAEMINLISDCYDKY